VFAGWLGDRMPKRYLLSIIYFARAAAIFAFISFPVTPVTCIAFGAVMGFMWLSTVPPTNGIIALMFGTRWLATLAGFAFFSHQVGGFLGPVGVLLGPFGLLARLLGQVARLLGQFAGLDGILLGAGLSLAAACVPGLAAACVLRHAVVAEVFGGVVVVFYRAAGHAIRLARLSHALAGGDLAGLVLSHDRFFPGEAARVCSPW